MAQAANEQAAELRLFHWQNDYGSFSISPSHVEQLRAYIRNQEQHHRKETFQDEFGLGADEVRRRL